MISIHTFELALDITSKNFNDLLSRAYQKAKKHKHRLGRSTKHTANDVRVDDALASEGITVEYHNNTYRKIVKFLVNPSKVLGGDDLKLWVPDGSNVQELLNRLEDHMEEYFDGDYCLDDFMLSRVEFTANLPVGKENVPVYIGLLHKIGKVTGYSLKYSKWDYLSGKVEKKHSFDLEGNTNGVAFTAYDKEADLKKKGKNNRAKKAVGVLRLEVRVKKRKSVQKILCGLPKGASLTTEEQIQVMAANSKHIFMNYLVGILPDGDFYKLKQAEYILRTSKIKERRKEKMLQLLRMVSEKQTLHLAFRELNIKEKTKELLWFSNVGVSPITLGKREKVDHLPSLYKYLEVTTG